MNRDSLVFSACGFILGLIIGSFLIGPKLASSKLAGNASAFAAEAPGAPPSDPSATSSMPAGGEAQMTAVRQQLDALKQRIAQDPKDADALVQLANMYMEVGKFAEAIDYYRRSLAVRDNPDVRTDLGICYKQSGQLDAAYAEFKRVEQEHPGEWQAVYNLAVVLTEMKRAGEARPLVAKLQQMRPGDENVAKLAAALK